MTADVAAAMWPEETLTVARAWGTTAAASGLAVLPGKIRWERPSRQACGGTPAGAERREGAALARLGSPQAVIAVRSGGSP